jgi:alpha-galactosidase
MAIRHVPVVLDICADMEKLCPDAWLIVENNPLAKICAAIQRHSQIKWLGFCNGSELFQTALEQLLDMSGHDPSVRNADELQREFLLPSGTVDLTLAGVNHLQWLLEVRSSSTGEDLYPKLRKRLGELEGEAIPAGIRFCGEICRRFGYFPSPVDNHVADYLWCVDDAIKKAAGLREYPYKHTPGSRDHNAWKQTADGVAGIEDAKRFIARKRTGRGPRIARHMFSKGSKYMQALNVLNRGAISNLPDDAVVEVPGLVAPDCVKAVRVGPLPENVLPFCQLHAVITNLAADAAAYGSRELALQALTLDPSIHSLTAAEKILEEILEYNKKYDTRFSR